MFGVTLITFILFNVVGGDPVTHYLGKSANPKEVELMKKEYGLDQPLINQYTDFLEEVVTFDFGRSYRTRDPVSEMLLDRIGPSLSLTLPHWSSRPCWVSRLPYSPHTIEVGLSTVHSLS